ncbi:DNA/RNA polymerase [Rhizopus microsporus var. microsporus]|uniref:DNA/RNA polymerase n=1 Tax=Rhizopus microsporus var. microsporus TaxID=86635 RepID=A0A1X0QRN9_RHIZD|nr:DNA/RNA polymerase [Rhizopus microsporus var. microsporus]
MMFDKAIQPYIDANQQLDKNTLCNLPEAVLYLPTPDNYVANIRQYPIPYTLQPKVMEIINSWLEDGIIVPAQPSAWNLPMTVTLKKNLDGTVLPVNNHQLPLISDIFNSMSNAVVFSTLNLKSAFNQFPVYGPDQVKTTFTAPNNLQYMYRGAPFGISTIN